MKNKATDFISCLRCDFGFNTTVSALISAAVGIAFTVYNGFLWIVYSSVWNGSICGYYVILAVVRIIAVRAKYLLKEQTSAVIVRKIKTAHVLSHIILLLITIALILPIAVMIEGKRSYGFGIIPAIAAAAYTTYRVAMAVVNLKRSRRSKNPFVAELRNINLIDVLVAVLLLQNMMIVVVDGEISSGMRILSICTSTAVWLAIAIISVYSFSSTKIRLTGLLEK